MNQELPDVQAGCRKSRRIRDQVTNICWIIVKAREFQKNIYCCFIDYAKSFYCADHNKLWKILQAIRIPDHLTCLLRNLYAGQEATVRTGHGTADWFQIGKSMPRLYFVTLLCRELGLRKVEKCLQTRLSTRAEHSCKRDVQLRILFVPMGKEHFLHTRMFL